MSNEPPSGAFLIFMLVLGVILLPTLVPFTVFMLALLPVFWIAALIYGGIQTIRQKRSPQASNAIPPNGPEHP